MSDPRLDPLEEEALRRVRANLLQAIRAHERAPRRRRTAMYAVGVGGAFAAGAAAYVVIDRTPDDSNVDTYYESPSATSRPQQESRAATSVTPTTIVTTTVAPAERPAEFVAVTLDGRLVVIDVATSAEVRELARRNDPRQPAGEGGPNVISGVTVDRANGIVYYETCCEPAVGAVWKVPLSGGESTLVQNVSWPALSGDGSTMVGLAADRVLLYALRDATGPLQSGVDPEVAIFHATLAPDGHLIAYERGAENDGAATSEIVVLRADALAPPDADDDTQRAVMASAKTWRDPEGVGWMHPAINRDGNVVVVQQCCYGTDAADVGATTRNARVVDPSTGEVVGSFTYGGAVVDQQYDASGTWLIVTLASGVVEWHGGGSSGGIGRGFVAAAW